MGYRAVKMIVAGLIHVIFLPGKELIGVDVLLGVALNFLSIEVKALVGLEEGSGLLAHGINLLDCK